MVGVDFSYLSKIENGILPPPSEKVILKLAEALHADQDDLFALAGRVPADIAPLLRNRKTLDLLRSERTRKKVMTKASAPRRPGLNFKPILTFNKYRNLSRVALALVLVIAVGTSLWFASPLPARALDITITPPSTGTLGNVHTFTVRVDVEDFDVLPVWRIDLEIFNTGDATKTATLTGLPLGDSTRSAHTVTPSSAGSAEVATSAESTWGYATAYSYGYGYRDPDGSGYHYFGTRGGYGYGYGSYSGATHIIYTVYWTSPSGWPAGNYQIKALVYGSATQKFSETSGTFSLSAAAAAPSPGGGGGGTPPKSEDLSDIVDDDGVFSESVAIESEDGEVNITIPRGTTGLTDEGEPLTEIIITERKSTPDPPVDTGFIGLNYEFEPSGATFDQPVTITFSYNPTWLPREVGPGNLVIAYYDEDTGEWVELDAANITIDIDNNTISATISHFTLFSVLAHIAPAAFTASDLTITPAEVDIADRVTIGATISNTGDLSGSHKAALKINGEETTTSEVSLGGHEATKITFITIHGSPGEYAVEVDGLKGSFTVRPAPSEPIVITVPPSPLPPTPTPAPAPPAPSPTPPTPVPTEGVNVWMLIIIAVATVVVAGVALWLFVFRREY
jgi:transcriptional regulator with XRE-family HTH domain